MRRWAGIASCLLMTAGFGCSPHLSRVLSGPGAVSVELPVVPRSSIEPDVSALRSHPAEHPRKWPDDYRRLTAAECRYLAIANAPFASDLDNHPDNTPVKHPHLHPLKPSPEEARVGRLVRGYTADELRNRAAGDALEEFYKLARAEGQYDLLLAAHAELSTQLKNAEEAIRQGLRGPDVDALRVQLFDLEAQMAELEAGIGSLNASLRARLALEAADPLPLWPDDPLRVRPDQVDADAAVRIGLHYRPDLNLLRVLLGGRGSSDVSQAVLAGINPLLVMAKTNPLLRMLLPLGDKPQRKVKEQLASALEGRERQAEAEIRAAVLTLHGRRAAARARLAEVQRLEAKVDEIEKRQKAGQQVTEELTKAKLDLLKSRGELLQSAADWNVAVVKLRQAMGLLVRE